MAEPLNPPCLHPVGTSNRCSQVMNLSTKISPQRLSECTYERYFILEDYLNYSGPTCRIPPRLFQPTQRISNMETEVQKHKGVQNGKCRIRVSISYHIISYHIISYHVCVYVCMCVCRYVCMYACMCEYVCASVCMVVCFRLFDCFGVYMCACMYIHKYIYIYIYIYGQALLLRTVICRASLH